MKRNNTLVLIIVFNLFVCINSVVSANQNDRMITTNESLSFLEQYQRSFQIAKTNHINGYYQKATSQLRKLLVMYYRLLVGKG